MSDTTIDLSLSADAGPGKSFQATVTVTGAKSSTKVTLRLEQERSGGAPPAVFEQTPVTDDEGRATGVFPVTAEGNGSFLLTATARQGTEPLGGSVKKVGDAAAKKVVILAETEKEVGQSIVATVVVDDATAHPPVTIRLEAERGVVAPADWQPAAPADKGRLSANFTVVYATAGASLLTATVRDARGLLGRGFTAIKVIEVP